MVRAVCGATIVHGPNSLLVLGFRVWVLFLVGVDTACGVVSGRVQVLSPDMQDRGLFKLINVSEIDTISCVESWDHNISRVSRGRPGSTERSRVSTAGGLVIKHLVPISLPQI